MTDHERSTSCACAPPAPIRRMTPAGSWGSWHCAKCSAPAAAPPGWDPRFDALYERARGLKSPEEFVREFGPPDRVESVDEIRSVRSRLAAAAAPGTARLLAQPEPTFKAEWTVEGGAYILMVQVDATGRMNLGVRPSRGSGGT